MSKNKIQSHAAKLLLVLFTVVLAFANARAEGVPAPVVTTTTVQFSIAIPTEFNSSISRVDGESEVNFYFKTSEGKSVFLFSVNKVAECLWMNVKDQIGNYQIIDHRSGFIFFTTRTDKSKLKGSDSEKYAQIFSSIDELIKSIKITEKLVDSSS